MFRQVIPSLVDNNHLSHVKYPLLQAQQLLFLGWDIQDVVLPE